MRKPGFAELGAAAAVLSLLGGPPETDEKRLKTCADALEVFGVERPATSALGAIIARDILIASAKVDDVEWHVAVLTGEAARELALGDVAAISRAYQDTTLGTWHIVPTTPHPLMFEVNDPDHQKILLEADGVPPVALRELAYALGRERRQRAEAPQA